MDTLDDGFGGQNGGENGPTEPDFRPPSDRLNDALDRVCEAWEVDAEGRELVARMRRAACRSTRRNRLPPAPILDVLRDAEHAPRGHDLLAAWHVCPLPVDRLYERTTLEDRVPDELRPRLLASFLRRRNMLLARRGEPVPQPPHDDLGHQPGPILTEEEAAEQWQSFLLRFDANSGGR